MLRVCIDTVWPQPSSRPLLEDVQPFDPVQILEYGLSHIYPDTIRDQLVQKKYGPAESSFQAALYCALNGLLPEPMVCLFEPRAKDQDRLDLIIVDKTNELKLGGYELKTNSLTRSEFKKSFKQARGYAKYYGITVHLVNFSLLGHLIEDVSV